MRRYELDGRRIKISPALEPDERFDRKKTRIRQVCVPQGKRICTALDTNESSKKNHYDQRADRCDD